MSPGGLERVLADERATILLGQDLAAAARAGDVFHLQGDLGSGKSTLARAFVRALAADPTLDVPSPTFTLVHDYATPLPVRHFDLYRISSAGELDELGFDDRDDAGVTLVEWPERGGENRGDAIVIALADEGTGRRARISGPPAALARIERSLDARSFLERVGTPGADRSHLSGDASARRYERVRDRIGGERILMDAPPLVLGPPVKGGLAYAEIAHSARHAGAFVAVAGLLAARGLSVPEIVAADLDRGFLLIGDLGQGSFLSVAGTPLPERYAAAAELLARLHSGPPWPQTARAGKVLHRIPPFDRDAMMIEVELLLEWYLPFLKGREATDEERVAFASAWSAVLDRLRGKEIGLVHRDFQSTNIVWRPGRKADDRLGILDFQDALIGPTAYDVASIALDARVDIPVDIARRTVDAYRAARLASAVAFDDEAFAEAYAIMAAQRNTKILGIFVRLDRRDGKAHYLRHLPRIRVYLRRVLSHPSLTEVAELYDRLGLLDGGDA